MRFSRISSLQWSKPALTWRPPFAPTLLLQAARLRESPLLSAMIEEGKLKVAAGYFDIRSGAVTLLDQQAKSNQARLVAVQVGCVLGVDDAQVACQPQFGLVVLTRRIDQGGLGVGQGSLGLYHGQVIVDPCLKTIRGLFQFLARQALRCFAPPAPARWLSAHPGCYPSTAG